MCTIIFFLVSLALYSKRIVSLVTLLSVTGAGLLIDILSYVQGARF